MAKAKTPATAQADASAYVRGEMPIQEQAATFQLFMGLSKWGSLAVACLLVFLTVSFYPGGSLAAGLMSAVVLGGLGFVGLKSKGGDAH